MSSFLAKTLVYSGRIFRNRIPYPGIIAAPSTDAGPGGVGSTRPSLLSKAQRLVSLRRMPCCTSDTVP
eukprot:747268-Hanusia_phi.AAC.3